MKGGRRVRLFIAVELPDPVRQHLRDVQSALRPDAPGALIVDFKTHEVGRERVAEIAAGYRLQVEVYTAAAGVRGEARMRLHFTHAGVVVEGGEVQEDG